MSEAKITIRQDSIKYLVMDKIVRTQYLYTQLFKERKVMTKDNAREYLELYSEYEHLVNMLKDLGIYNWYYIKEPIKERDIEII